jgi:hypothetical protein
VLASLPGVHIDRGFSAPVVESFKAEDCILEFPSEGNVQANAPVEYAGGVDPMACIPASEN